MDKEQKTNIDMGFEEIVNRVAQTDSKEVVTISKDNTTNYTIDQLIKEFEEKSQYNEHDAEIWYARDLQSLLGYDRWETFKNVISKAQDACVESNQATDDHFREGTKTINLPKGATRDIEDFQLSRYACYLTAQNADSRKKPVAFAQTYFAIQTRRQEIQDQPYKELTEEDKRILIRNEMKGHNKNLASAARDAGVIEPLDHAIFQNAGYKGLYDGLGGRDVKQLKGLKKKHSLLDHMGTEELAANMFRATQTEAKLRRDDIKGKQQANVTHFEVGKKVRDTIESFGGTMPEDLPPEEDIKKLEKRKKKDIVNKERKKLEK